MIRGMSSLGIRNIGLFLIGIVLLVIGLVVYNYQKNFGDYPYQTLGIILGVVGVVFMAFGFVTRFPTDKRARTTRKKATTVAENRGVSAFIGSGGGWGLAEVTKGVVWDPNPLATGSHTINVGWPLPVRQVNRLYQ